MARANCWPNPHDPEHLFTKAILMYGPLPPKGWSVTRFPDRSARYITPRGKDARAFHVAVIEFFAKEVAARYRIQEWSDAHHHQVGRRWKNQFYLWLWETIDANKD